MKTAPAKKSSALLHRKALLLSIKGHVPDHRLFHRFRNPQLRSQDPPVDGNDPLVPGAVGDKQFLFPLLRPDPNEKSPRPLPVIPPDLPSAVLPPSSHTSASPASGNRRSLHCRCRNTRCNWWSSKSKVSASPRTFYRGDKVCHRIGFPVLIGRTGHGITILLGVL